MNGMSCSHWGIVTWPDNEWKENVLVNGDGTISKMEDALPLMLQTKLPPGWEPFPFGRRITNHRTP